MKNALKGFSVLLVIAGLACAAQAATVKKGAVQDRTPLFTPLAAGLVIGPQEPPTEPTYPPTFSMEGSDCDGCFLACQNSYDSCTWSAEQCHKDGPLSRHCASVCDQGEQDCMSNARSACQ